MISLLQRYLSEGRLTEAEGLLTQILKKTPNDFFANHTLGVIMGSKGSHAEASECFLKAIKVKPNDPQANLNLAISLLQEKRLEESIKYYKKAVDYFPGRVDIRMDYAKILIQLSQFKLASATLQKVLGLDPNYAEAWYCLGNTYFLDGAPEEAVKNFNKATELVPSYSSAWNGKGTALAALKMYDQAAVCYQRAVEIDVNYSEAWYNLGSLFLLTGMPENAIESFNRALDLVPGYAEVWLNKGAAFRALQRYQEAVTCFQNAINISPQYVEAWSNLGDAYLKLVDFRQSEICLNKALEINPNSSDAWSNMAALSIEALDDERAYSYAQRAISCDSQSLSGFNNSATALANLRRFPEAVAAYKKILDISPYFDWALGSLMHNQMKTCDWSSYVDNVQKIQEGINAHHRATAPFPVLALVDDPGVHLKAAKNWVQNQCKEQYKIPDFSRFLPKKKGKIHIGYFSADFRNHPGAHLIIGLLEAHNKEKFEITAFSFGPDTQDEMRERLEKAFDRFIDIRHLSDQGAAALSREMGVDIAIDRNGHTGFNRQGIFANRAAPIQVGYLGYPSTTGAPWIDYLVADKTLIPDEQREHYSEKIIYMPNTYQPNDRKRAVSEKLFSRAELGLPEDGFVFCSFNNNYKITPNVFDGWMRILSKVHNSVLWILADNQWALENLQKEAEKRGIVRERIIFAKRMPMPDHLARHRCADLILDTYPYGAHTTASDALWVGIPVLTLEGKSFPARVCASLLHAIDLNELITKTQEEYENLAIKLANNPDLLQQIKLKLEQNRMIAPLFDAELYARNLEAGFEKIYRRMTEGLAPDHILLA